MMASVLSLVLAVILQLHVSVATGRLIWSYSQYGPHSHQLLSYKNKLQIQTTDNTTISLNSCISQDSDRSYHSVQCLRPGFQEALLNNWLENSTLYIPLENTPYCYSWVVTSDYSQVNSTRQVELRVRIQENEPDHSDQSDSVDAQFSSLGESPLLSVTTPSLSLIISAQGFNSSCNCWTFSVEADSIPHEFGVEIAGKGVIILDCGVRPTKVLISRTKFTNSAISLSSNTTSVQSSSDLLLYQDPQVSGVVVLLHGGRSFITQDDFQTIQQFQIPSLQEPLEEVTMTTGSLLLLANDSLYTLPAEEGALQLIVSSVEHVSAGGEHTLVAYGNNATLVAWSSQLSRVYWSTNGGLTFSEITLPSGANNIHSVLVHPSMSEVEVLLSTTNSTAHFRSYDFTLETWNSEWYNFTYRGGQLSSCFFPSVFGELLVWENTALYHSPNRGLTISQLSVYRVNSGGTLSEQHWDSLEYIKQVALGNRGQFAVLSSTNRLFYGTISIGRGIEIESGESSGSSAALVFNSIGELKIVSIRNVSLSVRKVPTYSLLLTALYPPPSCPYLHWQHSVIQAVYYLDSREHIELWATLTPGQWESNQISILVSHSSSVHVNMSHQLTQTAVEGSIQRNMTVQIRPSQPLAQSSSRTALKLVASSQNLACPEQAEAVTLISVQCPPTRHLRVKRPATHSTTNCPLYDNFSYTLRRDQYDPELRGRTNIPGNTDLVVNYDKERFGCPISLPHTSTYKPVLELYDGEVFIEEVEVDFVVWELIGRTDLSYTATANEVRCLSAPLSWEVLLENGTHPSLAWTPQTQRSCFVTDGPLLVRNAPYQILNKTGGSSLVWRGHDGVHLLVAQVVAPGYSYCDLRVYFAVDVYGVMNYAFIGYILLALTCLLGLTTLLVAYFCYRNMFRGGVKKSDKND